MATDALCIQTASKSIDSLLRFAQSPTERLSISLHTQSLCLWLLFLSADASGYGLYDHFPNDNVAAGFDASFTLRFECESNGTNQTRFPTVEPTLAPSTAPTLSPSPSPTSSPSAAPTGNECNTLRWDFYPTAWDDIECPTNIDADNLVLETLDAASFVPQEEMFNGRPLFRSDNDDGEYLYYSTMYGAWTVDLDADHALLAQNSSHLDFPPQNAVPGICGNMTNDECYPPFLWYILLFSFLSIL